MANVIREDVVQVSFDVDNSGLTQIAKDMNGFKKSVAGGTDSVDDLKKSVAGVGKDDGINKLTSNVDKLKNGLKKVSDQLSTIAKKATGAAFTGLKKLAGISFKALVAGMGAAVAGIGFLVKSAVSAYADFEQLKGGVETLFGAGGAKSVEEYAKSVNKSVAEVQGKYESLKASETTVLNNANDAFKTAGLSANAYMETVTSFSASLISSLGGDTEKAANYADTAIINMADNANKMGTDMGLIQNAYQGFAKQNYTMLDNLKLGYGGTKTEMERLIKDASKLDKSVKSNDTSFSNIVKAINAVQVNMHMSGLTAKQAAEAVKNGTMTQEQAMAEMGTTAKEASFTISGSLNSMKAAWGNLIPALVQGNGDFDRCIDNLIETIVGVEGVGGGVLANIVPAIEKALQGVSKVIDKVAPLLEQHFPALVEKLLPPLITAATSLVKGLIKALPSIIKVIINELPNIVKQLGQAIVEAFGVKSPVIAKMGEFFMNNAKSIAKALPYIAGFIGALISIKKISAKVASVKSIFGKSGKASGKTDDGVSSMVSPFEKLSQVKTSTVLKGMANLTIIIGGLTLLAAGLMYLAPKLANMTDIKSLIVVISVITVLGFVGAKLSMLAGQVGNIPVSTVAKGLANIAIIVAGMSALYLLIGAVSLINFDIKRILHISIVIGVLGAVGAALTVFAGIAGLIPIPIVLAGLANMALVIVGMTAIILAYGALSEIPRFTEFLQKGGETLALLFNIIGKVAGSLIGGLAEGITNSLPKIGENLSAFALSLSPLFTMFNGVDSTGIGNFFKSIGSFMLQMAGNDILSFFTGGTDFAGLGTGLTTFADNAAGFFTKVASFPENGFTNATSLFDCLAGLKSLPKEGGVVGWFSGGINFTSLSNGLAELSNEKVITFFNTVATIKQEGFDTAKKLFDCLAEIKSLPKSGGVASWFTGGIKYADIANGLKELSSSSVIDFFYSVSEIPENSFSSAKNLFSALAEISNLPKMGGLFGEGNNLDNLGTALKTFGESSSDFFTQVNGLNISKLNGLWESLKKPKDISSNTLTMVTKDIDEIVKKVTELPKKMGDGIKSSGESLSAALADVWKNAVIASIQPVNKVIDGANWILKQFGSKSKVATWTPYAKGTDGHKGGNALVNDGRGAELVQMPNGNTFIPKGRNVFLPNAPKGMKVLPAEQTASIMGRKSPTYKYAKGIGDIDIWEYMDNAAGLVGRVNSKFVDYKGMSGYALNVGRSMVTTISGEMTAWVKKLFDESGGASIASYVASKGVEQWRSTVIRALKMEGLYSEANVKRTLYQMQTESGGNPRAINLWDSNAKRGIPSKGLMQVIDPTFKAYAKNGFNTNIYDPLSNILASIRYAVSRYGSLTKAYSGHGYANGGIATKPSVFGEAGAEMAIPLTSNKRKRALGLWGETGDMLGVSAYTPENSKTTYSNSNNIENNSYAPVFNLTISGSNEDRATERKVKRWISEAMDEVFDSMARKNPKLQEV